jgi:Mg2+ and Co2+ transporter CorA
MNLQSRKMQMQDDIEKLLSDKFSKTISDSTALRLFKAVTQLLSLLSIKENDMRQKLININKKLERIKSNIFKTKTNIEIYAIAIKTENLTDVDVTTTARRNLNVLTTQQKIFTEIKKKKTIMIKINNETKKSIIRIMIIKDLMQKLKTIEKKKKDILSIKRLLSDDLKLLARFEKTKERMKQDKELLHDITLSTTAMRRTYVVLAHDVRMSNVNTFNQQKVINQIVKQNSSLHKDLNIVRVV